MKALTSSMTKLSIDEGATLRVERAREKIAAISLIGELLRDALDPKNKEQDLKGKILGVVESAKLGSDSDVSTIVAPLTNNFSPAAIKKALALTIHIVGKGLPDDLDEVEDSLKGIKRVTDLAPKCPVTVVGASAIIVEEGEFKGFDLKKDSDYSLYGYGVYKGSPVHYFVNNNAKEDPDRAIAIIGTPKGDIAKIVFGLRAVPAAVVGEGKYDQQVSFTATTATNIEEMIVMGGSATADITRRARGDKFASCTIVAQNTATMDLYRCVVRGDAIEIAKAADKKETQDLMGGNHACTTCPSSSLSCVNASRGASSALQKS